MPEHQRIISPDGRWLIRPEQHNSIAVYNQEQDRFWGSYLGHQDGVHRRVHATIEELSWVSSTLVHSVSSTGSIHLWQVPQCVHVQTLCPTSVSRGRTA